MPRIVIRDALPLAQNIRRARARARLTQEQLAEATGIPQSEISRFEGAYRWPTIEHLRALAPVLKVSVRRLAAPVLES